MATYRFRLTSVTTTDYVESPAAGQRAIGHLARIPDGNPWDGLPHIFNIGVPLGTRPGAVFTVAIQQEDA